MSLTMTMSILGLYSVDQTIFDDLTVPEAIDKDLLIPLVLDKTANLETFYPDPVFFKQMLGVWSKTRQVAWQRVTEALTMEYDPTANYDRKEEWTDDTSGEGSSTEGIITTGTTSTDSEDKVSAYNSSDYSPRGKNIGSGTVDNDTESVSGNNYKTAAKHQGRVSGNIGVTTTQAIIAEELNLRRTDPYDYIAEDIKQRFCLLVY